MSVKVSKRVLAGSTQTSDQSDFSHQDFPLLFLFFRSPNHSDAPHAPSS
jgi:hypothetical protein